MKQRTSCLDNEYILLDENSNAKTIKKSMVPTLLMEGSGGQHLNLLNNLNTMKIDNQTSLISWWKYTLPPRKWSCDKQMNKQIRIWWTSRSVNLRKYRGLETLLMTPRRCTQTHLLSEKEPQEWMTTFIREFNGKEKGGGGGVQRLRETWEIYEWNTKCGFLFGS